MKYLTWMIYFAVLASCSSVEEESVESIYKDVLPELVYKEPFFNSFDKPPLPPPLQREDEADEVYALRVKVTSLEEENRLLKDEISRGKKIYLLDKLLPIRPDSFRSAGITSIYDDYDSTWLRKSLFFEHKDQRPLNFDRSADLEAGLYDIKLIGKIPEPFTTKE